MAIVIEDGAASLPGHSGIFSALGAGECSK
jgi:hypothetical protein